MAKRPVFTPRFDGPPFAEEVVLEFTWAPGLSRAQAQRSIASLQQAAAARGISPVLEISSRSKDPLGVALSAFNLEVETPERGRMSVECAFQGSKVFEGGGPYEDLYAMSSREAKTDERIRSSGELIGFLFLGEEFPIRPTTAFYDWLYLRALSQNPHLAQGLADFAGFSDIAYNPERSLNCQARSAAVYLSLARAELFHHAVRDQSYYLALLALDPAGEQESL